MIFLHNKGSPSPWAPTLFLAPGADMLSHAKRLVSAVWRKPFSNFTPLRLWLQLPLTDQQQGELHTYCAGLSPTSRYSGVTTTLTVDIPVEMPVFRSSTQTISVVTHHHGELEISVARNRDTRSHRNPVRRNNREIVDRLAG